MPHPSNVERIERECASARARAGITVTENLTASAKFWDEVAKTAIARSSEAHAEEQARLARVMLAAVQGAS